MVKKEGRDGNKKVLVFNFPCYDCHGALCKFVIANVLRTGVAIEQFLPVRSVHTQI